MCCSPWGSKKLDTNERLNNNNQIEKGGKSGCREEERGGGGGGGAVAGNWSGAQEFSAWACPVGITCVPLGHVF